MRRDTFILIVKCLGAFVVIIALMYIMVQGLIRYQERYGYTPKGMVIRKDYIPADTDIERHRIEGSDPARYTYSANPVPEKYQLVIEGNGKTNWVDVPEKIWYETDVGDVFSRECFCVVPQ